MEEWRKINGFDNYSVSNFGNVRNDKTNKILKGGLDTKGYLMVQIINNDGERKRFGIHRLVGLVFLKKVEGKEYVDHIDRNKLNNRLENLRWVSNAENIRNQSKRNGYTSIYKGVNFDKSRNKWTSKMKINYKTINFGRFNTEEEAALAYNNYIIENNISCAILNDIKDI